MIETDGMASAIGDRIKALRLERGLSLDRLAALAAVSRAMLSRVERGESSPTAQFLGKVCAGLGITVSALFAEVESAHGPIRRRSEQAVWRDPGTGYVRRSIMPGGTGSAVDVSDITLPPTTRIAYDPLRLSSVDQHIWVLDGVLELGIGEGRHRLEAGDCIHMGFDQPVSFHNPGERPTRYAVIVGWRTMQP